MNILLSSPTSLAYLWTALPRLVLALVASQHPLRPNLCFDDCTMATTAHTPLPRPRTSLPSNIGRQSFYADRLYELDSMSDHGHVSRPASKALQKETEDDTKLPARMYRQDSGYASIGPRSLSLSRPGTRRRPSFTNTARSSSSNYGGRNGPVTRRSATSIAATRQSKSLKRSRPPTHTTVVPSTTTQEQAPKPLTLFHFPAPEAHESADAEAPVGAGMDDETAEAEAYPEPPQTTHYWTSDQTRRMEYAAIDAASHGFKGWMLRHVVPDCLVPKDLLRSAFDDNTGSVRRYRLELENEDSAGKTDEPGPAAEATAGDKKKKGRSCRCRWWPCSEGVGALGKPTAKQ